MPMEWTKLHWRPPHMKRYKENGAQAGTHKELSYETESDKV
jgi:hypothetical protein